MNTTQIETNCTVTHEGKTFESGGAVITPEYLIAYPKENGVLGDWHGNAIGTYSIVSSRPAVFFGRRSWIGDRYFYMRARVGKTVYALRGFGVGMVAKGKAVV